MKPTAAPAHFPYAHRTVEQADIDEAALRKILARNERINAYRRHKLREQSLHANTVSVKEKAGQTGACNTDPALTTYAFEVR